jgi:hypothetical protein
MDHFVDTIGFVIGWGIVGVVVAMPGEKEEDEVVLVFTVVVKPVESVDEDGFGSGLFLGEDENVVVVPAVLEELCSEFFDVVAVASFMAFVGDPAATGDEDRKFGGVAICRSKWMWVKWYRLM